MAFDQIVDEVKSWFHVRRTETAAGMFELMLNAAQIALIAGHVGEATSFERSLTYVLDFFGRVLDERLHAVRMRLSTEAKTRVTALLHGLASQVEELGREGDVGTLLHAIRTATSETQVEFERVATWFQRSSATTTAENVDFADTIEIAAELARTVAPKFDVSVDIALDVPLRIPGTLVTTMVDVFFVVFDNITKHAGASGRNRAAVTVEYKDGSIHVRIFNDVDPESRTHGGTRTNRANPW